MTASLDFIESEIPDTVPEQDTEHMPDATPDAPYGYKKDGTPYKRRPNGSGSTRRTSTGTRSSSSRVESKARQAAALLTQANALATMGVMAIGWSQTASALASANEGFEDTAYEALRQDEALCNTILKAGTTSAKITLLLAYGMLAVNVAPVAIMEYREKRDAASADETETEYAA